jgi:hypothetical protein
VNSRFVSFASMALIAAAVSGCTGASDLLTGRAQKSQVYSVPTGNQLAVPPDLALRAPSATVDDYQPNGPVATINPAPAETQIASAPATTNELYSAGPAAKRSGGTIDETLAYYNISKTNPDGSPKTKADINRELAAAIRAEKRRTNPNYGTIWNWGELFGG